MEFKSLSIPGSFCITSGVFRDKRGSFIKSFHAPSYKANCLESDFVEEYHTLSKRGVLRGLHFQCPPADLAKVVYCAAGSVMDAIVDIRVGSPTYGKFEVLTLAAETGAAIYIPRGVAHGFYTLSESATVVYKVTAVYSEEHDDGILWSSVGIPWPEERRIVSERDLGFLPFASYNSPFKFQDS